MHGYDPPHPRPSLAVPSQPTVGVSAAREGSAAAPAIVPVVAPVVAPVSAPVGREESRTRPLPALRSRVIESLLALLTSTGGGQLATLLATLALARLLAPADFGAISVASLVISTFTLLRNTFIYQTLIHRSERVREAADQMLILAVVSGAVLCIASVLGANEVAHFFRAPASAGVLRLVALAYFVDSCSTVPDTLLEKELLFRRKMWLELARPVLVAVVSVLLALLGLGALSVGWGDLSGYTVWTIGIYLLSDYRRLPRWNARLARELLEYGRYVFAGALMAFCFANLDNGSVARLLGARALGYYAFAFQLTYMPALVMTGGIVASVLMPFAAKLQEHPEAQGRAMLHTLRYVTYYAAPISVGTAVFGPLALRAVYGHKWEPALVPLQILSLYGFAQSYFIVVRTLCNGLGRARSFWRISGLQLLIVAPLVVPVALHLGIVGASVLFTMAKVVATGVGLWYVCSFTAVRWRQLLHPIVLPLALALAAAIGADLAGSLWGRHLPYARISLVLFDGLLFVAAYLCLCLVCDSDLRRAVRKVIPGAGRNR